MNVLKLPRNRLLELFNQHGPSCDVEISDWLRDGYSWAVPTPQAIATLVKHSPLIEIGAGRGYWAALASQAGADIVAFDKIPPVSKDLNFFHEEPGLFFPVKRGSWQEMRKYPGRTLFLCWPPDKSIFAYRCLSNCNKLIYVGEPRGGCTGDKQFFDALDRDWKLIERVPLPNWHDANDSMSVYKRLSHP